MNNYTINNFDKLLVSGSIKSSGEYIYKLRDLPNSDKPREKLLGHGPESLSLVELVAILINTGTIKEDVLAMSSRIIREYGEKSFASFTDPKKIADDLNIPISKACQLVASSELGRRFFKKSGGRNVTIRNAKDVNSYVKDMQDLPKEYLRGIYLNGHHKVIHDEVISMGTLDSNIIHPREVFRPGIEYGASAVILVHNHPSGVVTPSTADIDVTKQIVEAGKIIGISVLDHVIVGGGKYSSVPVDYNF